MNKDLHAYYQALGLKEGAGPAEIRRAYRQMVQTWHPDLFKPGSVMQMTAEDITKEVNEAYEQLYRKKLYRRFVQQAEPGGRSEPAPGTAGPAPGAAGPAAAEGAQQPRGSGKGPRRRSRPKGKGRSFDWRRLRPSRRVPWGRVTAVLGLAVAVAAAGPTAYDVLRRALFEARPLPPAPQAIDAGPVPEPGAATGRGGEPVRGVTAARVTAGMASAARVVDGPGVRSIRQLTAFDSIKVTAGATTRLGPGDFARLFEKAGALLEVFDVGDSKAKVIAVQGTPDDAGETVFRYGSSLVYFERGRVTGWTDRLPWLHVRPWAEPKLASLDTFSLGSTRGDVVRAQGQPTAFTPGSYVYGSSTVYFENDVVAGWSGGDVNLRSFDIPVLPFRDIGRLALR